MDSKKVLITMSGQTHDSLKKVKSLRFTSQNAIILEGLEMVLDKYSDQFSNSKQRNEELMMV